jgi:CRISPR-associated helicase Cas3/CRISPR-associated endonuclease Cas3-HD
VSYSFYAHSCEKESEEKWQLLKHHLENVAKLTGDAAAKFGARSCGETIGLLHDIGKYSYDFQALIRGKKSRVDHSTAGAKQAFKEYGHLGKILAYTIAGHHAGLPDGSQIFESGSSLEARLEKEVPDFSKFKDEISISNPSLPDLKLKTSFQLSFFIRMLFSTLIHGDRIDTASFYSNDIEVNSFDSISTLKDRLDNYLSSLVLKSSSNPVYNIRQKVLSAVKEHATLYSPGIFSLTVPTGGGKTLSSLAFALAHAEKYNLERVIYVIPFTTIIDQTANIFREALGDVNVLEHHSAVEREFSLEDDNEGELIRQSMESWNVPVVVTTTVQFFESLFSNRPSKCRKLHNICRSVIILDEVQSLPLSLLAPCLSVLEELAINYSCSPVLCTATQPAFKNHKLLTKSFSLEVRELAPEPHKLYQALKRVAVRFIGNTTLEKLASSIGEHHQALCIVDTRRQAQLLYQMLSEERGVYHLSTCMCATHRRAKLSEIRTALKQGFRCLLISTSLIEAGIDVDFPTVYRSCAGIDSIAQAAGRCNREGKLDCGEVYIFQVEGEQFKGEQSDRVRIGKKILQRNEDPLDLLSVQNFFSELYADVGEKHEFDEKEILKILERGKKGLDFTFNEVAKRFSLIESEQVPVLIPYDSKARELINEVKYHFNANLMRKLQSYTIQIFVHEFNDLKASGAIENLTATTAKEGETKRSEVWSLVNSSLYSEKYGLKLKGDKNLIEVSSLVI